MRVGKSGVREAKAAAGRDLSLRERIRRLEDSGLIEPVRGRVRRLPAPLPVEKELAQKWLQEESAERTPRTENPHL